MAHLKAQVNVVGHFIGRISFVIPNGKTRGPQWVKRRTI
jgi:hypothetical protein